MATACPYSPGSVNSSMRRSLCDQLFDMWDVGSLVPTYKRTDTINSQPCSSTSSWEAAHDARNTCGD